MSRRIEGIAFSTMQRAAIYFKFPGRFPRQARQASPQLEGEAGEGTPHFPASKPVQGHAERDPAVTGCLGAFLVLDKDS